MARANLVTTAIRLAGTVVGACALAAWPATCAEYDSSLLVFTYHSDAGPDAPAADATDGSEAAADAYAEADTSAPDASDGGSDTDAPVTTCDPSCSDPTVVRPPCPPDVPDPADNVEPLVFAMRTVRGGMSSAATDDWKTIGLDLDCLFTQSNGQPTMCKPLTTDTFVIRDGDRGRDNSFASNLGGVIRSMELFGVITYDVEQAWNDSLEQGGTGLVFSVDKFSGDPDDPQVLVSVYLSRGVYDQSGTSELVASWDGNDLWTIDRDSVSPLGTAKYLDDAAYVTGDRVVGHLPDGLPLKFVANAGVLELSLSNSVFVLEMSADHQRITSGVLAGVWYTSAAISALDSYAAQIGLCPDDPKYALARNALTSASDIRVDLKPAPNLDCNGMSIGIAFTADRAKLGATLDPPPVSPSQCGDAGTDASDDAN